MHECILTCKRFLKGGAKTASHQDAIDKGFEASPTSSACSWAEAPVAIEQFTHELIDRAIEKGKIDLLVDVVNPVPSLLTMHLLGLPLDEWQRFTMPMHEKNYAIPGSESAARARRGVEWFLRYVREQIAVQRKHPRPGLISYLMDADAIGESRIGGGDRLMQDRSLMATACEEFMRFTSPVHGLGRTAARDIELGGQQIKAGERILFLYGSANRDETEFSAPDEFQLDRFPNRHLGFGIGLHRCLGSTLARLMFSTMVGAVLDRMPDYAIDRSRTEHYPSIAAVNGWKALPASFTPGHKRLSKQIIPPWKDVIELGDKDAPGLSDAGAAWAFMALQATRLGLHAAASTSTVRGSTSVPASFRLEDTVTIGRRAGTGRVGERYPLSAYRTPALAFSRVSRTAELRARDIPQLAA